MALLLAALASSARAQQYSDCSPQPLALSATLLQAAYSAPGSPPYATCQTFSLALQSPVAPSAPGPKFVRVVVSGLTAGGDIDVFASENQTCPSAAPGGYNPAWGISTNAPPLPQVLTIPNAAGGYFYIAVCGYTSGSNLFSISAQDAALYQPLAPGVPVVGALPFGAPPAPYYYNTTFSLAVRPCASLPVSSPPPPPLLPLSLPHPNALKTLPPPHPSPSPRPLPPPLSWTLPPLAQQTWQWQ
jgi:hypothetical protein